jgi:nitrogen fixation protein NifU and related proteins
MGWMALDARDEFIEYILDHYENPRNRGRLMPADIVMKGANPACGDIVTLFLRINSRTEVIDQITFTGEGCTISQATASITTLKVQGQTLSVGRHLRAEDVLEGLKDVSLEMRRRCATLALHTLRAALTQYVQLQKEEIGGAGYSESGLEFECQPDRED